MDKQIAYWVEDDGQKIYFAGQDCGNRLLFYLRNNDPVVCGSDRLSSDTIKKLERLKEGEFLPESELI